MADQTAIKRFTGRPLLAAFFITIVSVGAVGGWAVHHREILQSEGKALVDSVVPALAKTWDPHQLLGLAAPKLRARFRLQDLQVFDQEEPILGPYGAYLGATDVKGISYLALFGVPTAATYVARVRFANGIVTFRMNIVRQEKRWAIDDFHMDEDVFGPPGLAVLQDLRGPPRR